MSDETPPHDLAEQLGACALQIKESTDSHVAQGDADVGPRFLAPVHIGDEGNTTEEDNECLSGDDVMNRTECKTLIDIDIGDRPIPMQFQVTSREILASTAAESCKGLYDEKLIVRATKELFDNYGHLNFKAQELAHLIEQKYTNPLSGHAAGRISSVDLGHLHDGPHVIELTTCSDCHSAGMVPDIQWIPPIERHNTQ